MLAARARGVLAAALVLGAVAQHEVPGKCEGMDKNDDNDLCDNDPASNGCGAPEARAGPQAYAKCMEVRLVLAYSNVSNTRWKSYPFTGDTGKEEGRCAPDQSGNQTTHGPSEKCPVEWNCNRRGMCRNGLYCGKDHKCHQCAGCFEPWRPDQPNLCGNCKTVFYPSVDEYSSLQIMDSCAGWKPADCDMHYGCESVPTVSGGTKCLPGPILCPGPGCPTHSQGPLLCSAKHRPSDCPDPPLKDSHTIFVPHQEMFLEVGSLKQGHGIVRSPIVVLSDHNVEVEAMYVKIGMVGGYPRKLVWEQTATINPGCNGSPEVHVPRSGKTVVQSLGAPCYVSGDDDAGCNTGPGLKFPNGSSIAGTTGYWPATECGFSTLLGSYKEGKFNGMLWPADTDVEKFPQANDKHTDCSQHMCGLSHDDARAEGVLPAQIFVSWTGEDVDGRDMSSGGLSYQSFHAFSVCLLALPTTAARATQLTCPSA
jgi:hypothetical protein